MLNEQENHLLHWSSYNVYQNKKFFLCPPPPPPPCRPILEDKRSSDDDSETMEMVGYTGRTASGMVKQMLNLRSRSNSTVQSTEEECPRIQNGSLTPVLGTPVHKPVLKQSKSLTKINKLRVQSEVYTHQNELVFLNDNAQLGSEGILQFTYSYM